MEDGLPNCLAAVAEQHSHRPSGKIKPAVLHTCAASARCKAILCTRAALLRNKKTVLVRLAAAVGGDGGGAFAGIQVRNLVLGTATLIPYNTEGLRAVVLVRSINNVL